MPFTLIYTRTDKWLISKEQVDWKIWNDKLYWFQASLEFETATAVAKFLREDFHLTEENEKYIVNALADNNKTYEIALAEGNAIKITPTQMDYLGSKGEIIDWQEWFYCFSKVSDKYHLWVYIGGIAEMCTEIVLSKDQIEKWEENGNSYIKTLATDLQRRDSNVLQEAQKEGRKVF